MMSTEGTEPEGGLPVVARDVRRTYLMGEPVDALDGLSLPLPAGSYTAVRDPAGQERAR